VIQNWVPEKGRYITIQKRRATPKKVRQMMWGGEHRTGKGVWCGFFEKSALEPAGEGKTLRRRKKKTP